MGMYQQFKTDPEVEKKGIDLNYGHFRVTVARSGGANKAYQRMLENKTRPYQRAIATGVMDNDRSMGIIREVFAETVILGWEVLAKKNENDELEMVEVNDPEGEFVKGIEGPDGTILPVTVENLVKTFEALPDLFFDLRAQSDNMQLFRQGLREELGKKSKPSLATSSSKDRTKKAS